MGLGDVATVADGVLHIAGSPYGYLQTERWSRDYALDLEWRWPSGEDDSPRAGNSGVLVHTTAPFIFYTWPRSLEVQLQSSSAGDFQVFGDGIDNRVEDEAASLRGTGIGCYFDDAVHQVLGLRGEQLQVLYHFTIGQLVDDERLQTHPPYAHLER